MNDKKKVKYVIDGIFLCKRMTGIQRYAYEITKELDSLVEKNTIEIIVPAWCDNIPDYNNIKIVKYGKKSVRLWEQIDLPCYLWKKRAYGIFYENTVPAWYKHGIVVVHDVSLKANPRLFRGSLKGVLSIAWRRYMYYIIMKSKMRIVTVSEFSKNEIKRYYDIDSKRITVIYNAWQHMNRVFSDESVFRDKRIVPGEYYFAMSTLAPNKNFKWIANAAKANPDKTFVIAGGGAIADVITTQYKKLNNIIYLGYVSDEVAKALMSKCRAFIFPSFYEGFGIPPLEAASCGAGGLILSDIESLHEVYGDSAVYVNPSNYGPNIEISILKRVNYGELLAEYSWARSANKFFKLLG